MANDKGRLRVKLFSLLLLSFLVVFLCRFAYELYFTANDLVVTYTNNEYGGYSSESSRKVTNVATDKIKQTDFSGQEVFLDQKYEKTANMASKTSDFESDNDRLRTVVTDNKAVIQMEKLSGLSGMRALDITIGVSPANFDKMVDEVKNIGHLTSFAVNKIDKTDEFKTLMAEAETLKKTRASYLVIKEKGGGVKDLLLLEDKILEVEKNLQNLGVNLGVYSTENSFCTVNLKLNEVSKRQISALFVLKAAKDSFVWSIFAFISLMFIVTVVFGFAAVSIEIFFFMKRKRPVQADGAEPTVKEDR